MGLTPAMAAYVPRAFWTADVHDRSPREVLRHGAMLLIDLCGFSAATQSLAKHGGEGSETVHRGLHTFFARTIDVVEQHGGDVVGFAGDSAIAVFEDDDEGSCLPRTLRCGNALLDDPGGADLDAGRRLSARVAIGVGTLRYLALGGVDDTWLAVTTGGALVEAVRADRLRAERRLTVARGGRGADPEPPRVQAAEQTSSHSLAAACGHLFVPEIIRRNQLPESYRVFPSELRHVTAVFLAVDPRLEADLALLHASTQAMQRICHEHGAWLYQLARDDKDLTFVFVLGVPTFTHENAAERALLLTHGAATALGGLGVMAKAGVATGGAFCGEYGTSTRRHYAVVGACMNRAARLAAAAEWGSLLCDADTQRLAERTSAATELRTLWLRGLGATPAYTFGAGRPLARARSPRSARPTEADELLRRAGTPGSGRPRVVFLTAEAGAGKTTLLAELAARARAADLEPLPICGERASSHPSLSAVRPFIAWVEERAGETGSAKLRELRARIDAQDAGDGGAPGGLHMVAQQLGRLVGRCLAEGGAAPVLCLVDDSHLVDSGSWQVLLRAAELAPLLTIIAAGRFDPLFHERHGAASGSFEQLNVSPLDNIGLTRVLCDRLDVDYVSGDLLDFVAERAQGNPLFAEELVRALESQAALRVDVHQGRRTARMKASNVHASTPPTLEGLIISRFDQLHITTREVGKAAAVLGEHVDHALLTHMLQGHEAEAECDVAISELVRAGWLAASTHGLRFAHGLYPEALANLLPPARKQELHRRAAERLEALGRVEDEGRLAQHWSAAGEAQRALPLLERAGARALRAQGLREAVELYRDAIGIRERLSDARVDVARAAAQRALGRALMGLTKHRDADDMLRRAMRSSGCDRPDNEWGLVRESAEYFARRSLRALGYRRPSVQTDCVREGANATADRAAVALWLGKPVRYARLCFTLANMGDGAPASKEAAWGLSSVAYLLAMTPARRLADAEFERGMRVAGATDDAETIASCLVLNGMALTATGRAHLAAPVLERAVHVSQALHESPWRHRAHFMLAEAKLELGEYEAAALAFDEAAIQARDAEPGIFGFTRALAGLACARLGRTEDARARIDGPYGVADARRNGAVLPLFSACGAEAQMRCELGLELPPQLADELEAQLAHWSETMAYYAGIHGHAGLVDIRLRAVESGTPGAHEAAWRAVRQLARFCRTYPAGLARLELARARLLRASGRHRQAVARLNVALRLATRAHQSHEVARCRERFSAWSPS